MFSVFICELGLLDSDLIVILLESLLIRIYAIFFP